jgi:metal-responsive CopG/Arc/MetJ family transcriptional regulator
MKGTPNRDEEVRVAVEKMVELYRHNQERYWKERSEEGRDLPKVPGNSHHLIDLLSKEIQESLRQIRDTIHDYEEYSMYRQESAVKSPIDLSILAHLRDDLAELAEKMGEEFHLMLGGNDYWRWSCCNDAEVAKELGREMESLAERDRSTN